MPVFTKYLINITIVFLSLCSISLYGNDARILIDGSDSMRGFFDSGALQDSIDEILKSAHDNELLIDREVFLSNYNDANIRVVKYEEFIKSKIFGTTTLLDRAYEYGKNNAKIIFIMTDNIHQEHEVDTQNFYHKFKDQDIKYIYIIPEILKFDGPLFFDRRDFYDYRAFKSKLNSSKYNGRLISSKSRQGEKSFIEYYEGDRGLIIYAILFDTEIEEKFFRTLAKLRDNYRDPFIVKPIDGRYIKINPIKDRDLAISMLKEYLKQNPNESGFAKNLPNMTLEEDKNLIIPLRNAFAPKFSLDNTNIIRFWFMPESKLPYVNIGNANNSESSQIELHVTDIKFSLKNESINKYVRLSERPSGKIVPSVFLGALPASSNTEISYKDRYCYITEVRFGPFKIDWNIVSFFSFLRYRNIPAFLSFNIRLIVPSHQISLTDEFNDKYFTHDMTKLDRIYTPVDLFTYLSEEPLIINIGVTME